VPGSIIGSPSVCDFFLPYTGIHAALLAPFDGADDAERTYRNRRNGSPFSGRSLHPERILRDMGSRMTLKITSLQNDRVKEIVKLRERRDREKASLFLIEGYRELKRALDAGRRAEALFYCPEFFLGSNEGALIAQAKERGAECFECSKEVFAKISYRDRPDGLLAVAPQVHLGLDDLEALLARKENPFLVVAESIEKPGNLGTILRSCDAAGVDAVIVCDPTTDIHNPNVVRSSVGTLFTLPVLEEEAQFLLLLS
jgi:TrmH family RNA methyltransferase